MNDRQSLFCVPSQHLSTVVGSSHFSKLCPIPATILQAVQHLGIVKTYLTVIITQLKLTLKLTTIVLHIVHEQCSVQCIITDASGLR